jgi:hypothetical protein
MPQETADVTAADKMLFHSSRNLRCYELVWQSGRMKREYYIIRALWRGAGVLDVASGCDKTSFYSLFI